MTADALPSTSASLSRRLVALALDHLVWFILLIVLAAFSLSIDGFFQPGIFVNILRQSTFVGILSIGLSLAVIAGHMDLSIESVMAFSAMFASFLVGTSGVGRGLDLPVPATLLLCACMGALVGAANGALIAWMGINAFIVTLASFIGMRGLGLILTQGGSIYGLPEGFRRIGSGELAGIPVLSLLLIACFLISHIVLKHMRFGRYITLIGGNPVAAFRAGIPVKRVLLGVFAASGALAAFAGWLLAARTNGATANLGMGMLFEAFAAVVIGGVSLKGGEGRLSGVFAGVLLLASIDTAINVMAMPPYTMQVVRAGLVLGAVLLDSGKTALRRRFL